MKQQHVILGAGTIGKELMKVLMSEGKNVVGITKTENDHSGFTETADLLDKSQTIEALTGATHVYMCVGLHYNSKSWRQDWPALMTNITEACVKNEAKLIFFDNMYMYGPSPLPVPFDEDTTQEPPSKKGEARKVAANIVLDAIKNKGLSALIARSADFYGRDAPYSMLHSQFLEKMVEGKNPGWLGSKGVKHTYAFVGDNAKAMSILADDDSAYGQTWHLPVSRPVDIEEVAQICSDVLGGNFKVSYMPRVMMRALGVFIPQLKELTEMMYQFDNDYVMDDSKFMNKYPDFPKTKLEDGLASMIASYTQVETKAT